MSETEEGNPRSKADVLDDNEYQIVRSCSTCIHGRGLNGHEILGDCAREDHKYVDSRTGVLHRGPAGKLFVCHDYAKNQDFVRAVRSFDRTMNRRETGNEKSTPKRRRTRGTDETCSS